MHTKSFEDLEVWKRSMALAVEIYSLTREFPPDERFGLSTQLRRAAVSIPSNIAEGSGHGSSRRNLHHVRIALGSNLELQTQLKLIERIGIAPEGRAKPASELAIEVGKMLHGLISSLERRLASST